MSDDSSLGPVIRDVGHQVIPPKRGNLPSDKNFANENDPSLILLCTWADARARHIEKQVIGYQELYPDSPILLVRTASKDFATFSQHLYKKAELPYRIIQQEISSAKPGAPSGGLLAHALSNGGSGHLLCIARRYHAETTSPLPIKALILDSTPVIPTFVALLKVLEMGLPRLQLIRQPLKFVAALVVLFYFFIPGWLGFHCIRKSMYRGLLMRGESGEIGDREWLNKNALRTYIYSDSDDLCPGRKIKEHILEATKRGFRVKEEAWKGSAHVAHLKADPERYWNTVRDTWDQA